MGKSAESVVSMLQIPGEVELCRNDLKGTRSSPPPTGRAATLGHHRHRLVHRLPHPVPRAEERGRPRRPPTGVGVQAGATFIAAMKHKNIDCGMTTEPTVSQAARPPTQAYILLDMRTAAGAAAGARRRIPGDLAVHDHRYVNAHKDIVQKLVNAYVKTLNWIQTHTAAQIADKMPADYYAGVGKAAYTKALDSEKGIYNPTGIMPPTGPATCLAVLQANADVKGKKIDLTKTYTDEFVKAATP